MNILVVRTDKLGDFITALPTLYALKADARSNKIIVCISPLNRALAESCDFIDEVISTQEDESAWALAKKIRAAKIDASITLFSNTKVALAQFLARVPIRIAPATKIAQIFYTQRVKQRRSQVKMAEFEYNLELAKVLFKDLDCSYIKPLLRFEDAKSIYKQFCHEQNITKPTVAFHVGFGGSSDANWSLDEYEILIRAVLTQEKYQVVLTFGPDEEHLLEDMKKRFESENILFYLSNEGLVNFAKLISNFKLFISTSTGTYHLASLVGTPTMTFFADSLFASAARWRGVGDVRIQTHYMLPSDKKKRQEMFEEVKTTLFCS